MENVKPVLIVITRPNGFEKTSKTPEILKHELVESHTSERPNNILEECNLKELNMVEHRIYSI